MGLVLDASAACELLLRGPGADAAERAIQRYDHVNVPHVLDLEVISALRRKLRRREITERRAGEALDDLRDLPLARFDHDVFATDIWEMRDWLSAYDASYVAIAATFKNGELVTADKRLARGVRRRLPDLHVTLVAS